MRSFIDTGVQLRQDDLHPEMFAGTSLVVIEGYTLCFDSVTQTAMKYAKKAGAKVAFNLGSFEITNHYKHAILELMAEYVDILFANAVETKVLTSLPPEKGCDSLKELCEIAIVTMGENGCWVGRGTEKIYQPAFQTANVVDTTGAGDLFASGFLNGHLAKKSLRECAQDGSFIASIVIQYLGVTIPTKKWEEIKKVL
jgi:sugar/nucleoside kinase (ribokinase family)